MGELSPEAVEWLRWSGGTGRRPPRPEESNRAAAELLQHGEAHGDRGAVTAAYWAAIPETALEIAIWGRCVGIIDGDEVVVPGLWADVMEVLWCSE